MDLFTACPGVNSGRAGAVQHVPLFQEDQPRRSRDQGEEVLQNDVVAAHVSIILICNMVATKNYDLAGRAGASLWIASKNQSRLRSDEREGACY